MQPYWFFLTFGEQALLSTSHPPNSPPFLYSLMTPGRCGVGALTGVHLSSNIRPVQIKICSAPLSNITLLFVFQPYLTYTQICQVSAVCIFTFTVLSMGVLLVLVCTVHTPRANRCQTRASDLQFHMAVSCEVLGIEPDAFGRAVRVLTAEPSLQPPLFLL